MRTRIAALVAVALGMGCTPAGNELVVQVVSDLAPVVEFDEIRIEAPAGAAPIVVPARQGAGYGRGVRVASIETTSTTVHVRVALFLRGAEVVSAARTRRVSGASSILTVRLDRDCVGVVCGDARAGACLGGVCVSDDCTPETPELCPIGECGPSAGGATCAPSTISCVESSCANEGICVDDPRDDRCGADEVCSAASGCVPVMRADAGPLDAGLPDTGLPDTGPPDAGVDVGVDSGLAPTPVARLAASAHYTNGFGSLYATPGMSDTGYEISSGDVVDGELLVFVACIDNGGPVWPNPVAPGFARVTEDFWGHDGETCVVDWKIASGEPASYAGVYGAAGGRSAVLALIAVSGVDSVEPISASWITVAAATDPDVDPVTSTSLGVTTTTPNSLLLYATAADWTCATLTTPTSMPPTGFSPLLHMGDRGDADKEWTALQIDAAEQAVPGPSGEVSSTTTSTPSCSATPWNILLAIRP